MNSVKSLFIKTCAHFSLKGSTVVQLQYICYTHNLSLHKHRAIIQIICFPMNGKVPSLQPQQRISWIKTTVPFPNPAPKTQNLRG